MIFLLFILMLFVGTASAQEIAILVAQSTPSLAWSYQTAPATCTLPTPNTLVRTSPSATGTYTTVATLPVSAITYALPATANNLYYRVETACGVSNVVQYVATAPPGPTIDQRVTTLETKVATLQLNETADDTAAAAVTARVTSIETKNTAQDTSIAAVQTKNTAQDTSLATQSTNITALQGQVANLTADLMSATEAIDARLDALETVPPPPPPAGSNLAVKDLNADQIEVTGLNCTSLKTTGTGVKRVITCVH